MADDAHSLDLALAAPFAPARDREGDIEALVLALFDRYHFRLVRYVQTFGLEAAVAEDVVQDVFLALFGHLRRARPQHNLRGWVFQVAHNLALRERRRRRLTSTDPLDEAAAMQLVDPASTPDRQLAEKAEYARVQSALRTLSERDRQCLYLRADGLRYREIARVMDMSLGGVAKSVARALGHLATFKGRSSNGPR